MERGLWNDQGCFFSVNYGTKKDMNKLQKASGLLQGLLQGRKWFKFRHNLDKILQFGAIFKFCYHVNIIIKKLLLHRSPCHNEFMPSKQNTSIASNPIQKQAFLLC